MRSLKVDFRPTATIDLLSIFDYIFEISGSADAAFRFSERIRERCKHIGNVPFGGRPRDDIAPGLRTVPFEKSTVIAYVVENDRVWITNIFYGGRDYETILRGTESGDL